MRALLEELGVSALFERFDATLEALLSASTAAELFDRILERVVADGGDGAERVLAALALSEGGLADQDLLSFAYASPQDLAMVRWGLDEALTDRDGRIVFAVGATPNASSPRTKIRPLTNLFHCRTRWFGWPRRRRGSATMRRF